MNGVIFLGSIVGIPKAVRGFRTNESLFYCPATPVNVIPASTNPQMIQALSFEDEEKHIYKFPLEHFQVLKNWLNDSDHFQRWTSYPLTAWRPEDVVAWQTQSILDWSLDDVMTLIQILDTIRYADEAELFQPNLPPLLGYWTYETFTNHFKPDSFLGEIQFN